MNEGNTDVWGFTHVKANKYSYSWTIKNYSYILADCGSKLESPIFSPGFNDDQKYCIAVWPNGKNKDCMDYVAMSFCNKSSVNVNIEFCISIIDKQGNKCNKSTKKSTIAFSSYDGFNNFIKKELLNERNGLLVDDVITFFCDYKIISGASASSSAISTYPPLELKDETLNAFEQQLDNEEFSDFTLVAPCGKKLFVHKFVLAARSPVFSAMFQSNMKEATEKSTIIKDVEYDVLKEMLRFMYAAKVENLDSLIYGLIAAADKYQIDGLKKLCEEYLFKSIKPQNMKDILNISIRYKLETLKDHVHKYLVCLSRSLFDSIGFDSDENIKVLAEAVDNLKFD